MASVSQFKIEQFNGKGSFTLWQRRVKDLLVQQGLYRALKGVDAKPAGMDDTDWEELEAKCVSTIRLCISDNIINNVIDEDDAADLWKKLEDLYLAKSLTNRLHLKRQLYRLKMADGGNLMEHMNVFSGLLDQLRKVDVVIEEEDKALLLLTSLPDSYESLVTTLLYGNDTLDLNMVQGALVSHVTHHVDKVPVVDMKVMAVQSGNRGKTSGDKGSGGAGRLGSKVMKGVQCYGCKEYGHIKRYCPKLNANNTNCANISAADDSDEGDVLTISEGKSVSPSEWVLDSGCTVHVCSNRKLYDTFQRCGGRLFLGDGSTVGVVGVGTVKLKMEDGAVRTLGGVKFFPRMRKNLISLSQLDSKGCKVVASGGAMEITRGKEVLMRGERFDGLYRLIGERVVPNISKGVWRWRAKVSKCKDDGERFISADGKGPRSLPMVNT